MPVTEVKEPPVGKIYPVEASKIPEPPTGKIKPDEDKNGNFVLGVIVQALGMAQGGNSAIENVEGEEPSPEMKAAMAKHDEYADVFVGAKVGLDALWQFKHGDIGGYFSAMLPVLGSDNAVGNLSAGLTVNSNYLDGELIWAVKLGGIYNLTYDSPGGEILGCVSYMPFLDKKFGFVSELGIMFTGVIGGAMASVGLKGMFDL